MLKVVKPRNARSKRALEKREAKEVENPKTALFIHGLRVSDTVKTAMVELAALKKPNVIMFNKKNEIAPFDDASSLEFFAGKNDASLFVVGSTQKKRKDNLVWVRTFDGQVLDMLEMGVLEGKAMREFKGTLKPGLGNRPLFHFSGPQFAVDESLNVDRVSAQELAASYLESEYPAHQHLKSLLMDFYRGEELPSGAQGLRPGEHQIALSGLQHVICVTAGEMSKSNGDVSAGKQDAEDALNAIESNKLAELYAAGNATSTSNATGASANIDRSFEGSIVHFRTYALDLRASGSRKPRVELQECGPSFDFVLRRRRPATFDALANTLKRPKTVLEKNSQGKGKRKNVGTDDMGDMVGQVHMERQDLDKLQTRKMKGLKAGPAAAQSGGESDEDKDEEGGDSNGGEEYSDDDEEIVYGEDSDEELEMEDLTSQPLGDAVAPSKKLKMA
ncbi:Brix-domain-containing protein [Tilletiaria anomala UBC 951]|uniref:Ribosome production factor 2 homolog n=1 Tax=Tilletiaria anomala (strain ATCC 24038 / CBS 436.72 / UBC 951) TaxID=1037660 RepID=A0A066VUZ9_TILAU|nr:Brix-domain-containing protein [Tilletiaria anomala UBC 951]KDN44123.1 Brix-domain-containing protein [Tilletiaria anomala UBC 951]